MIKEWMKRIRDFYSENFFKIDIFLAPVLGFLVVYVVVNLKIYEELHEWIASNYRELFFSIIGWSITLFGFVLASVSILVTAISPRLQKKFKHNPHLAKLVYDVHFSALKLLGVIILLAIAGILFSTPYVLLLIMISLTSLIVFRLTWSIWIMRKVIEVSIA